MTWVMDSVCSSYRTYWTLCNYAYMRRVCRVDALLVLHAGCSSQVTTTASLGQETRPLLAMSIMLCLWYMLLLLPWPSGLPCLATLPGVRMPMLLPYL